MTLVELGYRYPCLTEGEPIIIEDVAAEAGDILEFYLTPDREITDHDAARIAYEVAKIKEQYSESVIHYLKIDPWRVTAQYSVSPGGSPAFPPWWVIALAIVAIIVGIIALSAERIGYIFHGKPPVGNISLSAIACDNAECTYPSSLKVPYSLNGISGTTPDTIEELTPGTYVITWGYKEGYQTPFPAKVTIVAGETVSRTARYYSVGVVPPTTGWLIIDTHPVKGTVYIDGIEIGPAPQQQEVDLGDHVISFGDVGEYEAPPSQTCTVAPGDIIGIDGEYKKVGWPTWAKWAVGGGITLGIAGGVAALTRR